MGATEYTSTTARELFRRFRTTTAITSATSCSRIYRAAACLRPPRVSRRWRATNRSACRGLLWRGGRATKRKERLYKATGTPAGAGGERVSRIDTLIVKFTTTGG